MASHQQRKTSMSNDNQTTRSSKSKRIIPATSIDHGPSTDLRNQIEASIIAHLINKPLVDPRAKSINPQLFTGNPYHNGTKQKSLNQDIFKALLACLIEDKEPTTKEIYLKCNGNNAIYAFLKTLANKTEIIDLDQHAKSLNKIHVEQTLEPILKKIENKETTFNEKVKLLSEANRIASAMPSGAKWQIQFIHELLPEHNFLLTEAPEAPMLMKIINESSPKAFLRKGIVGQLVGAGGIGKTHWLAQLAIAVTTGGTFLDIYSIPVAGKVFLGLGENSTDDIHRLLRKVTRNYSDELLKTISAQLSVQSFVGMQASFIDRTGPTSFFDEFITQLKEKSPSGGWSLIILDPISRFLGADAETDNAAATQFIALLERITLEVPGNPTVLFGHHMSKSSLSNTNTDQTAARGSSALTDGVRWQANLEKVETDEKEPVKDQIKFKVVKSNFTAIPEPQILKKDGEGRLSNHILSKTQSDIEETVLIPAKKRK
jgi:hypothetical protein